MEVAAPPAQMPEVPPSVQEQPYTTPEPALPSANEENMAKPDQILKEFTVKGSNFAFAPNSLRVAKGDRVRLTFVNENGTHDWKLDEFNAATNIIKGGNSETIEFTADKTGTFEFYCSVGSHRAMGMKGTLIVE